MNKRLLSVSFLLLLSVLSFAQSVVRGVVRDTSGQPLPGVAVIVPGTSTGTMTGPDGSYSISVEKTGVKLEFSCVGFETVSAVAGQGSPDVVMKESSLLLDEAVAVGYGTMRKRDLTGFVGSVKAENLQNKVLLSVDDALFGRSRRSHGDLVFRKAGRRVKYARARCQFPHRKHFSAHRD